MPSPNDKYPSRSTVTQKRKHATRSPKRKQITTYHYGPTRTSLPNKHNLQEQRGSGNEDGETNFIPTIINDITNMTHMSQLNLRDKMSVNNQLSELREIINMNNRTVGSPQTKHKIVLIGDSNIRGYVHNLKPLLRENYELYSVIKPGATTNELKETTTEEINRLTCNYVILINYSINDYETNNFSITLQNIIDFIQRNNQTNIILMNLPYRYDLSNSIAVNRVITTLNGKLQKTLKAFPHTHFM